MKDIKFGLSQKKEPNHKGVATAIDIFSGFSGVITAWVATAHFIPSSVSNVIVSVLGLLVGLAQVLKPYFSTKTTEE
jgi:hypothetical protein